MAGIAIPPARLDELVAALGGDLDRDVASLGSQIIARVIPPEHASFDNDLVPVLRPRAIVAAMRCPAVLLVDASLVARVPSGRRWVHPNPSLVMARLLSRVVDHAVIDERSRAVVAMSARVHASAKVGAFAIIRDDVVIGPDSVIGPHAVIEPRVSIGARVIIGAHSVIGRPGFGWTHDEHGLVRMPQLGGVIIEDEVEVGPSCTVDSGTLGPTILRRGARLDAHVHVGHNVEIGACSIVAAQAGFAGSSRIGPGVLVGGQAGFADHVSIGAGARVAAKSGVIGDIAPGATVAGFPAVDRWRWLRAMAKLIGTPKSRRDE